MTIVTLRICDLCEPEALEPADSAAFGLDDQTYEIDLCHTHREQRNEAVALYLARARRRRQPMTLVAAPKRRRRS